MTLGQQLRQLRENAGYDILRLHQETRVSERFLRALEADDLEILPAATYVRGYLRHIAAALQAAAEPLLAAYDEALGAPLPPLQPPAMTADEARPVIEGEQADDAAAETCARPSGRNYLVDVIRLLQHLFGYLWSQLPSWRPGWRRLHRPVLMLLLALALTAIGLLLWHLSPPLPTSGDGRAAVPASEAIATDLAEPSPAPATSPADSVAPVPADDKTSPAPAVDATPAPTPAPAQPLDVVELRFHGPSVIRVTDARGRELAAGLQRAGQSLRLEGRKPFDVRVGNPAVTEVFVNGEPARFRAM